MKIIELELRSEVAIKEYAGLLAKLKKSGKLISKTRRCSVMFFGSAGGHKLDIRIRVTNGKAELVIKKGALHAHDRIEFSQPIQKNEMSGLARTFSLFGFASKVGERETMNFDFGKNTIVSLVKAGPIAYLEIERMSDKKDLLQNKRELVLLLKNLGYKSVDKNEFKDLCDRLSKHIDWEFGATKNDLKKLQNILNKY
ncbi:MAG: hypothetical protein PHS79_05450 [Patescibacteria group bacterium]|nr:hypothetical protein [Patescibacteria group bacterium]